MRNYKNSKIILRSAFYFLLSTFLVGCATAPTGRLARIQERVTIAGADYVPAQALAQSFGLDYQWDQITKKVILQKDEQEARFMAQSYVALLNQNARTMDKPAQLYQGSLVIPATFVRTNLSRFFQQEYIEQREIAKVSGDFPIKTVILDAGHGGKDPGAIGRRGLREKDVVLDISQRLKKKLNNYGVKVIMTRETDKFVSLDERSRIANANTRSADFFISVHANASRSKWTSGVEVFYLSESIDDNSRSLNALKDCGLNIKDGFSGKNTQAIIMDLLLSEYRRQSKKLARFICNSISKDLNQKNRGIKEARFYVLKAYIPAILIEVGFISSPAEEKKLQQGFYREKIAQAVADGIVEYNRCFDKTRSVRY
ncbi:MAG: N-acetylmuramoyl-L-alanine amidase [Candidatus Omnitrophica bacterium]|nr:N-acetylmuramoyl-L-alanine amidase [Candidatus Omnitrophota bacterium]